MVTRAYAQGKGAPFEAATVRALARELAQKPYKAPDNKLPDAFKDLTYDKYRMIRFQGDHALWRADGLPFRLQFFHRGFYYTNRVDIFEVNQGLAAPIVYSPAMFNFGDQPAPDIKDDLGFAGFRIHGPINRPDYFDEIGVFLGASYFRAVAKGEIYGLSARGLSIKTRRMSASASTSSGDTSTPAAGGTVSGIAPARVPTTGTPWAMASA